MKRLLPMLVALTVVAQVAQAAHFVLVAHSVCAEHGELVHHAHDDDTHAVTQHEDEDAPNALYAAHVEDADQHDHCSTVSEQRQRIVPDRIESPQVAESALPTPVVTEHVAVVVLDCLDVAPKSSPPVV